MPKYFTFYERTKIETFLESGFTPRQIAEKLDRSFTAVYREIKRGQTKQLDTHLKPYYKYFAETGQRVQDSRSHNKGAKLKYKNEKKALEMIEKGINGEKSAPYAISVRIRRTVPHTTICTGTIYNYIHKGLIPNVKTENPIYKTKKKKDTAENNKRIRYQKSGAKSIEDRPREIKERDTYGHWEMDTVYSGKDKSRECLLVLTERMARHEKLYKLKDRTAQSVLDKINDIEKQMGYEKFKNTFLTITVDNGGEFALHKEIEQSCTCGLPRTQIYFCHPFASSERGSNENANKLIRKYIPKGEDIAKYSDEQIHEIENKINSYPRKLFGGLSSDEYAVLKGII